MTSQIEKFIKDQLSVWPEVSARFRALKSAGVRRLEAGGLEVVLQHNPARLASAVAGTPADTLAGTPCFLCRENLPAEQAVLPFDGRKGRKYRIQINPFPIFPKHLVIASEKHEPQSIWHHFVDILDMARSLEGFTIFYNGPLSGASAPEHLHFQACPRGMLPLENAVDSLFGRIREESLEDVHYDIPGDLEYLTRVQEAVVYHYRHFMRGLFALRGRTSKSVGKLFYRLLESVPLSEGDKEPKFNLFVWHDGTEYRAVVVLRDRHRTHHFYSDGPDHLTMAPGCADVAGYLIVPDPEDFAKLDSGLLSSLLDEAAVRPEVERDIVWRLKRRQRKVEVGIMSGPEIRFEIISDGAGPQKVSYREGKIDYGGVLYDELVFDAVTKEAGPDLCRLAEIHRRRRQGHCGEPCRNRGLSGKRDLFRDEGFRFAGIPQGSCRYLALLAAVADGGAPPRQACGRARPAAAGARRADTLVGPRRPQAVRRVCR